MATTFFPSSHSNIPAFFYPTTILLVDDDPGALQAESIALLEHYKTVTFSDPDKAIDYLTDKRSAFFRGHAISGKIEKGILEFRKEVYNDNRFQDVLIAVLDYDMPNKSGFDVWQDVGLNDYHHRHQHSYILLTAKRYADFEEDLANAAVGKNFISKFDPNYAQYLLENINKLSTDMFQSMSHGIANRLIHDGEDKTSFLNDGNFLTILNTYLQKHAICEGYLFDRQGSLLLVDKKANLSWLIVRNEQGIKNSIARAKQFGAPNSVLSALESKKIILSLYEQEDFVNKGKINWDDYLLEASVFKDTGKQLEVFEHIPSDYYYAFTDNFPESGIDRTKIFSYESFLNQ